MESGCLLIRGVVVKLSPPHPQPLSNPPRSPLQGGMTKDAIAFFARERGAREDIASYIFEH
ncbi:hypothetical protein MC7420_7862 [Coleofasciculus chthonoplastes PCC 7420]|uniref:Uncharacterized protein n=1 Tax=Coleofasciculus chthonoplastes PCC 7420 TaxID=118168 RepID=B4VIZ7_9CYAN|nr:hypothetical protein MC7420_7862 [Coleofasciculus chthonoplastes PCC 7420]